MLFMELFSRCTGKWDVRRLALGERVLEPLQLRIWVEE